jgi:hypothetical protein
MGCILYELAVGRKAFCNDVATIEYKYRGKELLHPVPETFTTDSQEDITRNILVMLRVDPLERPPAGNLLEEFSGYCVLIGAHESGRHQQDLHALPVATISWQSAVKNESLPGSIHHIASRLMANGEGQSGGCLNLETRVGELGEKQTELPWQSTPSIYNHDV